MHTHTFYKYEDGIHCPCGEPGISETIMDENTQQPTEGENQAPEVAPEQPTDQTADVPAETAPEQPVAPEEPTAPEAPVEEAVPADPTQTYFDTILGDIQRAVTSLEDFKKQNPGVAGRRVSIVITNLEQAGLWVNAVMDELELV